MPLNRSNLKKMRKIFECFVVFKMVKYVEVKYIGINDTKTSAEKCTEGSTLQSNIMLFASCPANIQRQSQIYVHVQKIPK